MASTTPTTQVESQVVSLEPLPVPTFATPPSKPGLSQYTPVSSSTLCPAETPKTVAHNQTSAGSSTSPFLQSNTATASFNNGLELLSQLASPHRRGCFLARARSASSLAKRCLELDAEPMPDIHPHGKSKKAKQLVFDDESSADPDLLSQGTDPLPPTSLSSPDQLDSCPPMLSGTQQASQVPALPSNVAEPSKAKRQAKRKARSSKDEHQADVKGPAKSLGLVCQKVFFWLLRHKGGSTVVHSLHAITDTLSIDRRRLYEVINLFEAIELVTRVARDQFTWNGTSNLDDSLKTIHSSYLTSEKTPNFEKRLRESSLGIVCRLFMGLLIAESRVPTLDSAARVLFGSKLINPQKYKTKLKRLYDIANFLRTMGLAERVFDAHVELQESGHKKPSYVWTGMLNISEREGVAPFQLPVYCSSQSKDRLAQATTTPAPATPVATQQPTAANPSQNSQHKSKSPRSMKQRSASLLEQHVDNVPCSQQSTCNDEPGTGVHRTTSSSSSSSSSSSTSSSTASSKSVPSMPTQANGTKHSPPLSSTVSAVAAASMDASAPHPLHGYSSQPLSTQQQQQHMQQAFAAASMAHDMNLAAAAAASQGLPCAPPHYSPLQRDIPALLHQINTLLRHSNYQLTLRFSPPSSPTHPSSQPTSESDASKPVQTPV
eukprot:m.3667 g.3667  ORF g.3667 m.3667 type:complete len:661 (-) comp4275_c0_seq2:542-2524(-)